MGECCGIKVFRVRIRSDQIIGKVCEPPLGGLLLIGVKSENHFVRAVKMIVVCPDTFFQVVTPMFADNDNPRAFEFREAFPFVHIIFDMADFPIGFLGSKNVGLSGLFSVFPLFLH